MNRKIAAILAADVAGYSRLVAVDEEGALRRLVDAQAVFKERIAAFRGRIFNTAGDAILAEFPSAVDATRAALDIQREMADRNDGIPPDDRFLFRIGLNIGDVVEHEGDLLGDGVNVAARIQALAPAGGLAISHWVREHTSGKINVPFRDIGRKSLKNIPAPVHVFVADLAPVPAKTAGPHDNAVSAHNSLAVKIAAASALILALGAVALTQFRAPQPASPSLEAAKPAPPPPTIEKAKAAAPVESPAPPAPVTKRPETQTAVPSPAPASQPATATPVAVPSPPVVAPPAALAPKQETARPIEPPPAKTVVIPMPAPQPQPPIATAPAKSEKEATAPDRKGSKQTCAEVLERAQIGDVTAEDRAFLRNQCR